MYRVLFYAKALWFLYSRKKSLSICKSEIILYFCTPFGREAFPFRYQQII